MTWGTHCHQCGLLDCHWVAGPSCEGLERLKAFAQFPPELCTPLPWGLRWIARRISKHLVQVESENEYFRKVMKKEFGDIRLVAMNIKPDEFQMHLRSGIGGLLTSWMAQALQSIGAKSYVEIMGEHPEFGKVAFTVMQISGESAGAKAKRYENMIRSYVTPRPLAEWQEDMGDVLWWHFDDQGRVTEPPYCGSPLHLGRSLHIIDGPQVSVDNVGRLKPEGTTKMHRIDTGGWPGYHTHFTRIPEASLNWKPPEAPPVNMRAGSPA